MEPGSCPDEFVVVAAPGIVEVGGIGDGIGVFTAIGVGKVEELGSVSEELIGIGGVSGSEGY